MKHQVIAGLLAVLATPLGMAQTATVPVTRVTPERAIESELEALHGRASFPGATIGFVLPGGASGSVSVGVAFTETDVPMGADHRMMAGSTGKTFFAALTLQLVGEDVLTLDAKISGWLEGAPWLDRLPNGRDLTLRMLLNHTSGLPRYVMMPEFADAMTDDPDRRWEPLELLAFVLDDEPLFPAGAGWSYADTNFVVVGVIVERVTGESCYNQIHARFLRPLGLCDVTATTSRDVLGLAGGYVDPQRNLLRLEEPNVVQRGRYVFNPQFEWAGGGFATTPHDLARWARSLYGDDLLAPSLQREMRAAVPARLGPGSRYGLGMMERPSDAGTVIGHAGYFPGYLTDMAYYVDHDLALTIQVNTTKMSPTLNPRTLQQTLDACAVAIVEQLR